MAAVTSEQRAELLRWAEALESGKYKQTDGMLRNENTGAFCCLGVYADACGAEWKVLGMSSRSTPFVGGARVDKESEEHLKASWLKEKTGVKDQRPLSEANDGGRTFPEIAVMLRRYASEGMFEGPRGK